MSRYRQQRERTRDRVNSITGLGELEEGEKGRRENLSSVQNSHKFAHNVPHMGLCGSLCKFENVLFSKENRTHKSHIFAQCEQNDHAYMAQPHPRRATFHWAIWANRFFDLSPADAVECSCIVLIVFEGEVLGRDNCCMQEEGLCDKADFADKLSL